MPSLSLFCSRASAYQQRKTSHLADCPISNPYDLFSEPHFLSWNLLICLQLTCHVTSTKQVLWPELFPGRSSYVEEPTTNGTIFVVRWVLRWSEVIGVGPYLIGLLSSQDETSGSWFSLSSIWRCSEKAANCRPGRELSPETDYTGTLTSDVQPPEL